MLSAVPSALKGAPEGNNAPGGAGAICVHGRSPVGASQQKSQVMGRCPAQERIWQRALPDRTLASSAAAELAPAVAPPGVHEVGMYWMAHPVPPFPDVHGAVPALGAHGARADAAAVPNGFAQPSGNQPALPPRRLVQSWAVYSEPGDGRRGASDAACAGVRDYGAMGGQARSLQGLAEVVAQPSGRAAADAGQAHSGMPGLPRAYVRAPAEDVSARGPAVAPLGQAPLVPEEWAVGGGATAFMDVCDEEGLGAFGGGGAGFGAGGGGGGFPDLPGVADESELAAVLGFLPPAAAQHAARLTAAGPGLIEELNASGGSAMRERQSQVRQAGLRALACVQGWQILSSMRGPPSRERRTSYSAMGQEAAALAPGHCFALAINQMLRPFTVSSVPLCR